jgi:UDP-glucose 4-epimerase
LAVFNLAMDRDARSIVLASSEAVAGFAYPVTEIVPSPQFLPLDESHPLHATDPYGLSKILLEHWANRYATLRPSSVVVSLRFCWLIEPREYFQKLRDVRRDLKRARSKMFSYLDIRDAATACAAALQAARTGHHIYYVCANDTLSQTPTRALVAEEFPSVPYRPEDPAYHSLISNRRLFGELGIHPKHSWRQNYIDEDT